MLDEIFGESDFDTAGVEETEKNLRDIIDITKDRERHTTTHLGHTISSIYIDNYETKDMETINYIRENLYEDRKEEHKAKMLKELNELLNHDGTATTYIYRWFFERIAGDCRFNSKYSMNEYMESDALMQMGLNKIAEKPRLFDHKSILRNYRILFQLGGGNLCRKLPNYPYAECKRLLERHVKGDSKKGKVYIDPCCGWGIRMLASASLGMDYVGFDVNPDLIVKLNELGKYIKYFKRDFNFKIIPHGSEIFVDDLVNTADVIFTSPPYYQLEDYGKPIEGSIEIMNISYEEWLESFARPMLKNMITYAKPGCDVMINIKNIPDYPMLDDFSRIMVEEGGDKIVMQEYDKLTNIKRTVAKTNKDGEWEPTLLDNNEKIIVGRKQ